MGLLATTGCDDGARRIEIDHGDAVPSSAESSSAVPRTARANPTPTTEAANTAEQELPPEGATATSAYDAPSASTEAQEVPESAAASSNPGLVTAASVSTASSMPVPSNSEGLPTEVAEILGLEPKKAAELKQKVNGESKCTATPAPEADSCSLELGCSGTLSKTSCTRDGQTWYCYCQSGSQKVNYDLKTDRSALACAAGIGYCRPSAAQVLPKPVCNAMPASVTALGCSKRKTCESRFQVGKSTEVHVPFTDHLFICDTKNSVLTCGCSDDVLGKILPNQQDPATACDTLIDGCFEHPTTPTTGFECAPAKTDPNSTDTCSSRFTCGYRLDVNGKAVALSNIYEHILYCNTWGYDTSYYACQCGLAPKLNLDFRVKNNDVCAYAYELCATPVAPQVTSSAKASCVEPRTERADPEICNYSEVCSVAGAANGHASTFADRIMAECVPSGSQWECSCLASYSQTLFKLNATNSADACTQAFPRCTASARLAYTVSQGITFEFPSP